MAELTDQELIELWHDQRSAIILARESGISSTALDANWRRLKKMNLLPEGKRPVAYSARQSERQSEPEDSRPPLFYQDMLLKKLIEVHGTPPQKKK
jgi:hypothetical protein